MAKKHRRTAKPKKTSPKKAPRPTIHDALAAEASLARSALDPSLPIGDEAALNAIDPATEAEVEEILHDTQTAIDETRGIVGPSRADRAREAALAGGDVDAASDQPDGGDESVGGSTPTPDQDVVDELGRAAGVTYADDEPLRPEEKEAERDDDRWELDPASAEDYEERMRERARPSRPRPPH